MQVYMCNRKFLTDRMLSKCDSISVEPDADVRVILFSLITSEAQFMCYTTSIWLCKKQMCYPILLACARRVYVLSYFFQVWSSLVYYSICSRSDARFGINPFLSDLSHVYLLPYFFQIWVMCICYPIFCQTWDTFICYPILCQTWGTFIWYPIFCQIWGTFTYIDVIVLSYFLSKPGLKIVYFILFPSDLRKVYVRVILYHHTWGDVI